MRYGLALFFTIAAAVQDMKSFKISNKKIMAGILSAAVCMVIELLMGGECFEEVISGLSVFGVLYIIYLIGAIGAGDVKLLTVIGLLCGKTVWRVTVLAFVIALITGILGIVFNKLQKREIKVMDCKRVKLHIVHFSIAIFAAELSTVCMYIL